MTIDHLARAHELLAEADEAIAAREAFTTSDPQMYNHMNAQRDQFVCDRRERAVVHAVTALIERLPEPVSREVSTSWLVSGVGIDQPVWIDDAKDEHDAIEQAMPRLAGNISRADLSAREYSWVRYRSEARG